MVPESGTCLAGTAAKPARRIVICGSMAFYSVMRQAQQELTDADVLSLLPDPEDASHAAMSVQHYETFKKRASAAHIRRIRHPLTACILVLNIMRHGLPDYIGPSTYAEAAVAHAARKRIFLLNGYPAVYADQLRTWDARCLNGCLDVLVRAFHQDRTHQHYQTEMFVGA